MPQPPAIWPNGNSTELTGLRVINCAELDTHGNTGNPAPQEIIRSDRYLGGSYRDRTDDIHGVNVALYQLS